jgi:hypothetical protein
MEYDREEEHQEEETSTSSKRTKLTRPITIRTKVNSKYAKGITFPTPRLYFDWLAKELGIEKQIQWYDVTAQDTSIFLFFLYLSYPKLTLFKNNLEG